MNLFKRISLVFSLFIVMIFCSQSTFCNDGDVFQGDDGKYYKIINGNKCEVDFGEDSSITDIFKGYKDTIKADSEVMQDVTEEVISPIGTIISFIIYLIFAFTAFTTVTDLAYIALPPIRPFLYSGDSSADNIGTSNLNQRELNNAQRRAENNRR